MNTHQKLQQLAEKLIKKVKNSLCLGSSNKAIDIINTGGFSEIAIGALRCNTSYHKENSGYNIEFGKEKPTSSNPLKACAQIAAYALTSKAGNCIEMSTLAAIYALKNNSHTLDITIVALKAPLDHCFVIITDKTTSHRVICDPWLNIALPVHNENAAIQQLRPLLINKAKEVAACDEASILTQAYYLQQLQMLIASESLKYEYKLEIVTPQQKKVFLATMETTYHALISNNKKRKKAHAKKFKKSLEAINEMGLLSRKGVSFCGAAEIPTQRAGTPDLDERRVMRQRSQP